MEEEPISRVKLLCVEREVKYAMWTQLYRRSLLHRAALWLALVGILGSMGADRAVAEGAKSVTVPLIQRGAHILVETMLDDKPALMILDTGAGVNLVTPEAEKRLNLKPDKGRVNVQGAGGSAAPATAVKIGKLEVGASTLKAQSAYIIPLPDALECDGLLGTPFFREWVVQIDYVKLQLTLTPRGAFQPSAEDKAFPIRFNNNIPEVEATVDGIKGQFHVDTGAGDALTLFGPFVAKRHLRGKYMPSVQTVTGRGVGGLIYGDLVRVPEFSIGQFHFSRVTTALSRQTEGAFAGRESAGNLGGEIWKRFTLTLDYAENKIFLARNSRYEEPFVPNRSGFALDINQGVMLIRDVMPDSPASEADIHAGDTLLMIDGTPTDRIKAWTVSEIFRSEPGKKLRLRLRNTDMTEYDTTLTLRDLL